MIAGKHWYESLSVHVYVCLNSVAYLTSQQQASVSQGRICTDNFMHCHTEIEAAVRSNFPHHPVTVYWHQADQSQCWPYNATRLAGVPLECKFFSHWYDSTWKNPGASGIRTLDICSRGRRLNHYASEVVFENSWGHMQYLLTCSFSKHTSLHSSHVDMHIHTQIHTYTNECTHEHAHTHAHPHADKHQIPNIHNLFQILLFLIIFRQLQFKKWKQKMKKRVTKTMSGKTEIRSRVFHLRPSIL